MKRLLYAGISVAVVVIVLLMIAGCMGSLPTDMRSVSPEVAKVMAGDNKIVVSCGVANSPWGQGVVWHLVADAGTVRNGMVTVGEKCNSLQFTNTTAAPAKAASAP